MGKLISNKKETLIQQYRTITERIDKLSVFERNNKLNAFELHELNNLRSQLPKLKTKMVLLGITYESDISG